MFKAFREISQNDPQLVSAENIWSMFNHRCALIYSKGAWRCYLWQYFDRKRGHLPVNRCYLLSGSLSSSLWWRKPGRLACLAVLTSQVTFWGFNLCFIVYSDHSGKPLDQCISGVFKYKCYCLYVRNVIVLAFKLQYVTYGNNGNFILILIFYYSSSCFTHDFYCNIVIYKKALWIVLWSRVW